MPKRGMQRSILCNQIAACRLCPRLVRYRESVKPAKRFASWKYWHKPVPGFGDREARILILGLAPSAHGGNRTGRVFTGDPSGDFLFNAIYKAGMSNQNMSRDMNDGLVLRDVYVSAAVKCAPPDNKPKEAEAKRCITTFLIKELDALKNVKVIVALGSFALSWLGYALDRMGVDTSEIEDFSHGNVHMAGSYRILVSYHVSPRNTNTGKLTEAMFVELLNKAKELAGE
jgi:uracil-DNA glycosylase family 4